MDKILLILRSLRKKEISRLINYLNSQYFEVPLKLKVFGLGLISYYQANGFEKSDKKVVWEILYPSETFNDSKWRRLKTEFFKTIEMFLYMERVQVYNFRNDLEVLNDLDERGENELFEKKINSLKNKLKLPHRSGKEIFLKAQIFESAYNFYRSRHDPNKENEKEHQYLEQRERMLTDYLLFEKLKTATALENRRLMEHSVPDLEFPLNFQSYVELQLSGQEPLFQIFAILLIALQKNEEALYLEFERQFLIHNGRFEKEENQLLFNFAINHAIRSYRERPSQTNAMRLLDVYKEGLAMGILSNRWGEMSSDHFKNLITLAVRTADPDFAEKVFKHYRNRLVEHPNRKSTIHFCDALLAFNQKEFRRCLRLLQEVDAKGYFKIEIRTYEMKALYELKQWEVLESKFDSYSHFIQRSKISTNRMRLEKERLQYLKRILHLNPNERNKENQLIEELRSKGFHDRDWLIEKIEEKSRS